MASKNANYRGRNEKWSYFLKGRFLDAGKDLETKISCEDFKDREKRELSTKILENCVILRLHAAGNSNSQ